MLNHFTKGLSRLGMFLTFMVVFSVNLIAQPTIGIGTIPAGNVGSDVLVPVNASGLTGQNLKGLQFTLNVPSDIVFFYELEFTGGNMENQSRSSELFNPDSPPAGNQDAAAITVTLSSGSLDVLENGTLFYIRGKRINTGSGNVGVANVIVSAGATTINGVSGAPVAMTVGAGTPRNLTVGDASGTPGSTDVLIPVTVSDLSNYGVYGYNFTFTYDDTKFDIVSATRTGSITPTGSGPQFDFNTLTPNQFTVSLVNAVPLSGSGILFYLNLTLIADSGGPIALTMAQANLRNGKVQVTIDNGEVTVSPELPTPTLTTVNPNSVVAGAPNTLITLTGTGFVASSVARVNGVGVATTYVSPTSLTATIPAANLTTSANLTITVFNSTAGGGGGSSNGIPFTVGNPAPVPSNMSTGAFYWGSNTGISINGTAIFNGATVNAGAGVTVSGYDYTNAPTSVTFNATVAAGTTIGIRPLTIQNTGSSAVNVPGDVDIRYKAPTFTSIVPSSAIQGATLNVQVTGTDFFDETQVKTALALGNGITVNSVTIDNFSQITANITIDPAATVGPRDVTLTNAVSGTSGGSDVESNGFSVLLDGNPVPTITSINPTSGVQGTTVNVTVNGSNFDQSYTTVGFGASTSTSNLIVNNSTSLTVDVIIGANAPLGLRDVTVTNAGPGGGIDVLDDAFTVLPIPNANPVANGDLYATPFNTALVVNAPGVLGNDTDDEGVGNLTALLVTNVGSGTLSLSNNGGFTYTPPNGFSGNVQFTYRAVDSDGGQSNIATVTITVGGPANGAPLANDDNYNTAFNTALVVAAPGFLGNDIDDGGVGNLQAQVINPAPGNVGTIVIGTNGSINYTPATGFSGTFEFTYRATDGQGAPSNLATVRITVAGTANATPTANDDNYAVAAGATLTIVAPGILANDTDDGGVANLTAELVQTQNMSGSFNLNANGSFTYTPIANFFGVSTFTYRARDAQNTASNIATVTIVVGLAAPTHNGNWPAGQNPFVSTSPTLSFNPVVGAQYYDVQVSKSTNFGPDQTYDVCYPDCGSVMKVTSAESNTITFTTFNTSVVASGLKAATQYYWRARAAAMNGVVKGAWSDLRSFITVAAPNAPVLVGPNNNATGIPAAAELSWLATPNATNYNVQVSLNPNFDVNIVDANTGSLSYVTPALSGGPVFYWRVKATGIGGESVWSEVRKFTRAALVSIDDDDTGIPTEYVLEQNYPNPFNPSTTISFRLPESADVTLQVFNLHGQVVGTIMQNVTKNAGNHTVSFDASNLSSGVYIYRIVAGSFTASQKMVLVK